MKTLSLLRKIVSLVILSFVFTACVKDRDPKNKQPGITFYALAGNKLDKFSTSNPEKIINSANITGLQSGEKIAGIDFRPATGELYGLGSNSRLYVINPSSGVATLVAALTTVPAGGRLQSLCHFQEHLLDLILTLLLTAYV